MQADSSPNLVGVLLRARWHLLLPAVLIAGASALPAVYLLMRALQADPEGLRTFLFSGRMAELLGHTLLLLGGVLAATTALALPAAWLTTCTDLPARRLFTVLAVLPLAVPPYLMAYTLLGLGGVNGAAAGLLGVAVPRPAGFWGALIALSLYNYPYMFLNLRVGLHHLDPSIEDTARTLGERGAGLGWRVLLPQLRPSLLAGAMLVSLHVVADFGVVSLMRYETLSYAVYFQYQNAYDRMQAAFPALLLIAVAGGVLAIEAALLMRLRVDATTARPARAPRGRPLGRARMPCAGALTLLALLSVGVPAATILFWSSQRFDGNALAAVGDALGDSLLASAPAAVLTPLLALPLARLRQQGGRGGLLLERAALLGYATPALAFALGMIFFTVRMAPWLYQSLGLLIVAYALHFLAEALGPVRSGLLPARPRLEEAARTLGCGRAAAFGRVTLPLLRSGLGVAAALVFLSAMKELPLTFLLSPLGFDSLAMNVFAYSEEAMFARAGPFALAILLVSSLFVGLLLRQGPTAAD